MNTCTVIVKKICDECGEETIYTRNKADNSVGIRMHAGSMMKYRLGAIGIACEQCGNEESTYLQVQVRPAIGGNVKEPREST